MNAIKANIPQTKVAKGKSILFYLGIFLAGALIIYLSVYAFKNNRNLSTPDNIRRIQDLQRQNLEPIWTGTTQTKKGIATEVEGIPSDQRLLINTSVLATRLIGYSGPYNSGVFDEDTATRFAIGSGARCLVLEIDRDTGGYEPKLIYRDEWGIRQSLNTGSIEKVAKSITGRAFTASNDAVPPQMQNDPLIVVLYFVSTPNTTKEPREYVRFLGKVAKALQPLNDYIVGQTPQGDFRRQALETQLFFQPWSVFSRRIILLCNADTTPFRRLESMGLAGEINSSEDLDLMVHCRLYSKESPSNLGITSAPTANISPSAVITTPRYWLDTPPDRLADSQAQTKKAWTLVMYPCATEKNAVSAENMKRLYTEFGVHAIPFCIFDSKPVIDSFTGKGSVFDKSGWIVKSELLRFIPPRPIILEKPSPKTNAYGGTIFSPEV